MPPGAPAPSLPGAPAPSPSRPVPIIKLAAHLSLFLVALLAGVAAGTPEALERAGRRAEVALERILDVDLEYGHVDWTTRGRITLEDVVVRARASTAAEPALMALDRVLVEAEPAWSKRKLRLRSIAVQGARVALVRRSDGSDNAQRVLAGALEILRGGRGDDAGQGEVAGAAGRLSRWIERRVPALSIQGLDVDLATSPSLPLIGPRVALRGGELEVSNPALLVEDDHLAIDLRFEETSLDPGHGVAVHASLPLAAVRDAGGAAASPTLELSFDRPVRAWLGRRALAASALRYSGETLSAERVALSVPLLGEDGVASFEGAAGRREGEPVDPAIAASRVSVRGDLGAAIRSARLALADGDLDAALRALATHVDAVEVIEPVILFEQRPEGHNFQDLVRLDPAAARELTPLDLAGPDRALGPVMAATRTAIERLTRGEVDRTGIGFRAFLTGGFTTLATDVQRLSALLTRAASALPVREVAIRGGRLAWRTPLGESLAPEDEHASVAGKLENFDLSARKEGELLVFEAAFRVPGSDRERNRVDGRVHLGTGDVQLHAAVDHLRLWPYRQVFPKRLPVERSTRLEGTDLSLVWSPSTQVARLDGTLGLEGGVFAYPPLSPEPLRDLDVGLEFSGQLDVGRKTIVLGKSRLQLGGVKATVRGDVSRYDDLPKLTGVLRLDRSRCQDIVDALPRGLAPMLDGLRVDGTLAWQLDLSLDTSDMESLVYHSQPELHGFRVSDMGTRLNLDAVRGTFLHRIQEADGSVHELLVGPGSPEWAGLGDISPWMVQAVTTTEDGSFFRHKGFSTYAIRQSIVTNLKKGGFYRGASTISQQLTKNLFLSREKTISRKLQEAFITWQLESTLDKEHMMALYLNIIEFGPGIYGIRKASEVYFGKHPAELDALEAVFVASLIPNPKRYYHQFERGEVTDGWRRHLRWIMRVMVDRGKLDEETFYRAAPYSPRFRDPEAPLGPRPQAPAPDDEVFEVPGEGGELPGWPFDEPTPTRMELHDFP